MGPILDDLVPLSSTTELALSPHVYLRAPSPIEASVDVYTGLADHLPDENPVVAYALSDRVGESYDSVTCTNAVDRPGFSNAAAAVGFLPANAAEPDAVESDSIATHSDDDRCAVFVLVFAFDDVVTGDDASALTCDAADVRNIVLGTQSVRFEATVPTSHLLSVETRCWTRTTNSSQSIPAIHIPFRRIRGTARER